MKIVQQDQNHLIIKNGNSAGLLLGGLFLCIGILLLSKPSYINSEIPWWGSIIVLLLGLISIVLPTWDTVIFDRGQNKLKIEMGNIFGKQKNAFILDQVKEVELYAVRGESRPAYKLACNLKDGSRVVLNPTKSSSATTISAGGAVWNILPERKTGEKLALFLNVPFVENTKIPSVTEALSAISEGIQSAAEKYAKDNPPLQ